MLVRHARIFAVLIFGLSGGAGAGAGQEGNDMKLEDVGFVMRPANTPAQIERLRQLPPRTFIARSKSGRRYFLYADPDYCKCVFVGGALLRIFFPPLPPPPAVSLATLLGVLAMAVWLSNHFSKVRSQAPHP